jgi:predicted ATP-dependent endonuclease of OLD family
MKLVAFRINNFKSIIDTGWRDLSTDNITGLIGQNESGKSSVLQALHSFYDGVLDEDYLRGDESLPKVSCSFEVEPDQLQAFFSEYQLPDDLVKVVKSANNRVNFVRVWTDLENSTLYLEQEKLVEVFTKDSAPEPAED